MRTTRTRLAATLVTSTLILAACGGDDDDAGSQTATANVTTTAAAAAQTTAANVTTTAAAATTTRAPATTVAVATTAPAAASAATCNGLTAPAAGATAVATTLIEWAVNTPATVKAGPVAFTIKNDASATHQFMLVKGTYEALPKIANGALDEAQLGANLLGQVRMSGNQTCAAGFTLTPGSYAIVCNINQGPNSHAARGQKINFTVA
jgi:hypothetical protein